MEPFALFGGPHLSAIAATLVVGLGVARAVRNRPQRQHLACVVMGAFMLASGLGFVAVEAAAGIPWSSIAPLHLCDIAVFVGAAALFTRNQRAFELLYFWGLTGTFLAMVTPELAEEFPHHRFIFYFCQHGSIVMGALLLAVGLEMRPKERAPLRAWLWLNLVAVGVGVVDWVFSVNFLYLREKPAASTPLDWFGDWPFYLLACEGIALGMFLLLGLPFVSRKDLRPSS